MDPVVTTLSSGWALLAIAIVALVTRYGNAYLTSPDAPDWITGPLALALAGAGGVAMYLSNVKGVGTWEGALTAAGAALTAAYGVHAADPGIEPALKSTVGGPLPKVAAAGSTAIPDTADAYNLDTAAPSGAPELVPVDAPVPELTVPTEEHEAMYPKADAPEAKK